MKKKEKAKRHKRHVKTSCKPSKGVGRGNAVRHCPECGKAGVNGRSHPAHLKK